MRNEYEAGEYLAKRAEDLVKEKAEWAMVLARNPKRIVRAKKKTLLQLFLSLFR